MKQTAVEWYEQEVNSLIEKYEATEISKRDFIIMKHNLFYQAKAMEKEQIEDSFLAGSDDGCCMKSIYQAEQYYNETYVK